MAKITLGSWGTYYFVSGTNTPDYDGDWELNWTFQYEQNQSTGITTVYVQPFVRRYVSPVPVGTSYVIPAISVSTTINGNTKTQHTPRVIGEYNGSDYYYAYGTTQTWTVDQSQTGTGRVVFNGSGTVGGVTRAASHTYSLPTINVASTITNDTSSSSRKNLGNTVTFTITAPNSTITNTVSYTVNNTTTTIGTVTGNGTLTWSFPDSLADAFTTTSTPNLTINMTSSNGTNATTTVYLNIPDTSEFLPVVTATLSDAWTDKHSAFNGVFIQNNSIANMVFTVTFKHNATANSSIPYTLIDVNGSSSHPTNTSNRVTVTSTGSKTFTITVTDSRGKSVTATSNTIVSYAYNLPSISGKVERCLSDGTLDNDGTYAKLTIINWDISPVNNLNYKSISYSVNGGSSVGIPISSYSGTNLSVIISNISTVQSTQIDVDITDEQFGTSIQLTLSPSFVTQSLYNGGEGVTFGQTATQAGFHCYMDAQFHNTLKDSSGNTLTAPNNGTLTIQKNGTTVETFAANQSSNVTANITVPTKTSELTNDSGFMSTATQIRNDTGFGGTQKTYTDGYNGYKFYILLGKAASSNSGYSTAIVPAALVTSSGISIVIADEAAFVRCTLTSSGTNLLYTDNGRTSSGYIQYIYGVK